MPNTSPTVPGRQLVKAEVIMKKLDIADIRRLNRLIDEDGLPVHVLGPKLRRFDPVEVDAWIDSRWSLHMSANARCTSPTPDQKAS
jgi:predicted DNA-binding transcriptional regulator AlpA